MSRYRAGADFERKVRDHLYAEGATLVVRSAGSKTPVDLVAFWSDEWDRLHEIELPRTPWLVQVKRDGKLYGKSKATFIALAERLHVTPVLAKAGMDGRRRTIEFVELAA